MLCQYPLFCVTYTFCNPIARLLNSGISEWGHVIDTKVEYCFLCNSCIYLLKALEAEKAPARKSIHNWSCGQYNFAGEDKRLWTEGRKIIAFGFFVFHRWKSTNRAGAIPVFKTCVTERSCTKSETFANRTYYTGSQLTTENCSILKRKQTLLLFQWWILDDE